MDDIDGIDRIEEIGLPRPGRATPDIHTSDGARWKQHDRTTRGALGQGHVTHQNALDCSQTTVGHTRILAHGHSRNEERHGKCPDAPPRIRDAPTNPLCGEGQIIHQVLRAQGEGGGAAARVVRQPIR